MNRGIVPTKLDTFTDQVALVARGVGRSCILGYEGPGIYGALLDDGNCIDAPDNVFPLKDYPSSPGIYIWRGDVALWMHDEDVWYEFVRSEWAVADETDMQFMLGHTDPMPQEQESEPC